jgi:hypothetical protein
MYKTQKMKAATWRYYIYTSLININQLINNYKDLIVRVVFNLN